VAIALLLLEVVSVGGCSLDVGNNSTLFACDVSGACPADHVCVDHFCVPETDVPACTKAIATGAQHSCAIRSDGTTWCWGRNDFGQLGDGTTDDRTTPVMVQAPRGTTFTAIAGGLDHTCAIDTARQVWCWGSNNLTQLGNTKVGAASKLPVMVQDVKAATQIASGDSHTCAVTETGMQCWGSNNVGQIGNHSTNLSCPPVEPLLTAAGAGPVVAIGASGNTTCAADATKMWCWGSDGNGQFGNGSPPDANAATKHDMPVASGFANVSQIAVGGSATCVIDTSHTIWCAGRGGRGELATGATADVTTPMPIAFNLPATSLVIGGAFACATDDQARVWCWGGDDTNQLASAAIDADQLEPVVSDFGAALAISAGSGHVCALGHGGSLTCAGDDSRGQLGDRHRTTQGVPQGVPGLTDVASIAGGTTSVCATKADHSVWCWANNDTGQLGDGSKTPRQTPTLAALISGATQVVMGDSFACALAADGSVSCWGQNASGELGDGTTASRVLPRPVLIDSQTALTGIAKLTGTATHVCGLTTDQRVYCWGGNGVGESGVATNTPVMFVTLVPVPSAMSPVPVLDVAAGRSHTCAVTQAHEVWCWGWADHNRLAVALAGTATTTSVPVDSLVRGADQVAAHENFTCARAVADGSLQCWGDDANGQLGDGQTNEAKTVTVNGLNNIASVSVSSQHACAVNGKDGSVVCWGLGARGQIGDNGYASRRTPGQVLNLTGVTSLATTNVSTCALLADHTVACWGEDRDGELGDGELQGNTPVVPLLPCP
jgi:alpha-tubulin suppressor-like RCC1 family protein